MRTVLFTIENNEPVKTFIMRDGSLKKVCGREVTQRHYQKVISAILKLNWTGSGDAYSREYTAYNKGEWER